MLLSIPLTISVAHFCNIDDRLLQMLTEQPIKFDEQDALWWCDRTQWPCELKLKEVKSLNIPCTVWSQAKKMRKLPWGFQDFSQVVQNWKVQIICCFLPDLAGRYNERALSDSDAIKNGPFHVELLGYNCLPQDHTAGPGKRACSGGTQTQSSGPLNSRDTEPTERSGGWPDCSSSSAGKLATTRSTKHIKKAEKSGWGGCDC